MSEEKWKRLSVVSLKFIEQFGELEWFEEQPSGAKSVRVRAPFALFAAAVLF
jgi:hypothetical protein